MVRSVRDAGGGRATRPRAPAVSPGGCGAPPSVYRRQTPTNARARWLLVLRYSTVSMPCLVGTVFPVHGSVIGQTATRSSIAGQMFVDRIGLRRVGLNSAVQLLLMFDLSSPGEE